MVANLNELVMVASLNSFLQDLEEEVHTVQSPKLKIWKMGKKYFHLNKALYGLKNSFRAWLEKFNETLTKIG